MENRRNPNSRSEFSLNQIDLNLLRVFDMLMQERSVTKAAFRTGRTQSAVSHSLGKLRDIFKDELFTRDSGLMEPTPRANELSIVISSALADIRLAVNRHLHFDASETFRNFRIGVTDYIAVALLPRLIENFARAAPNATLNVLHVQESNALTRLKNREVECAIVGNAHLNDPDLVEVVLSMDKMVCAGWSGNLILDSFDAERYLASPHLQISSDGVSDGFADIALKKMNLKRKVVATIPHYLVAPWIIKGTDLITAFGDSILPVLPRESETRVVLPPIPLPDLKVSLIYERNLEVDPAHSWLRGLIQDVSDTQQKLKAEFYEQA
ncbi:LysR family transcriptional regulator [Paraburkholderia aspalathi]|nr:LysR family transcriptional regulator [Paraburkholderia aspalathi]